MSLEVSALDLVGELHKLPHLRNDRERRDQRGNRILIQLWMIGAHVPCRTGTLNGSSPTANLVRSTLR